MTTSSLTTRQHTPEHRLRPQAEPTFVELFTPKLVTILREGYGLAQFKADVMSGLTVAVLALPLSMALAIASGVTPDRGLYAAIVGGFLVSALGGSRFQIGGPAGAFIVLVAACVERNGVDGVLLATTMAGIFLMLIGFLRLGTYIKFIPYPVTVGFTSGIAVIIFASQVADLLGLTLPGKEPGPFVPKVEMLVSAVPTINASAAAVAALTLGIIYGLKKIRPSWPGMLIAIGIVSIVAFALGLSIETIGTRFGEIPRILPAPALPSFSLEKVHAVLPDAIAFALLGSIESLLSAVVADGMTGRRHRSNCELVAQGVANIASALFGGICVTGTIARTATNVRSGARSPISGMLHSAFLLAFMMLAAPLASYIPLASLAAVLAGVAWNMTEKTEFATLIRSSWGDALVLLATFLLTVFYGLTEGIVVGFAIGAILFINRMAQASGVERQAQMVTRDKADDANGERTEYDAGLATDRDILVYRITGVLFFGAASAIANVLEQITNTHRVFIIDFAAVPFLDSTGANMIAGICRKAARAKIKVFITGTTAAMRQSLVRHGVKPPAVTYKHTIADALASAHRSRAAATDH
jgi:SulP family sulfate permease